MNFEQRTAVRIKDQENAIASGAWLCCANCEFFNAAEVCVVFNQKPPANIIARGCEKHCDPIPF